MTSSRRIWIKQASYTLAALGIGPSVLASPGQQDMPGLPEATRPPGNIILLNSNENAYGPSTNAQKAMTKALSASNRYPDEEVPAFKKKLASFWHLGSENILMGAGSSEILGLVSLYLGMQKGNVVTAKPSYSVWEKQAGQYGLSFVYVPLNDDKKLDLDKMLAAVNAETRMVYICNPNNPTGTWTEHAKLQAFVAECSKKCFVLVDEAYTEFADLPSLSPEASVNPNILVAKTFSKIYGLAGARAGYAISHPDTIKKLSALQAWPDVAVSQVTAAAASAALDDQEFVKYCRQKTAESRQMVYDCCKELKLDYIPSSTSFVLFNIDPLKCDITQAMEKKNIMVQYRQHFGGKWCRVSMGTTEEMKAFCASLRQICA
jgi:histidinol-phosphate aminotransferase